MSKKMFKDGKWLVKKKANKANFCVKCIMVYLFVSLIQLKSI